MCDDVGSQQKQTDVNGPSSSGSVLEEYAPTSNHESNELPQSILSANVDIGGATVQYYDETGQRYMLDIDNEQFTELVNAVHNSNNIQDENAADDKSQSNNESYDGDGEVSNDSVTGTNSQRGGVADATFLVPKQVKFKENQNVAKCTGEGTSQILISSGTATNIVTMNTIDLSHDIDLTNTPRHVATLNSMPAILKDLPVLNNNTTINSDKSLSMIASITNEPVASVSESQQDNQTTQVQPPADTERPPLGSSENPIRILQQGNQYTPIQQLNAEQLQQIMHVLQNQQMSKAGTNSGGTSVMYNPNTNTRIIYKVMYPKEGNDGNTGTSLKRSHSDDDDDDSHLAKERKKIIPRTRSGRLSKPPKHMVDDYKRIHTLEWDEDYDDDDGDGGYSDIKFVQDEIPVPEPEILPLKPKNWVCKVCDRRYIGEANLLRHFAREPSHNPLNATGKGERDNGTEPDNDVALSDNSNLGPHGDIDDENASEALNEKEITNDDTTSHDAVNDESLKRKDPASDDYVNNESDKSAEVNEKLSEPVITSGVDETENQVDQPVKRPRGRPRGSCVSGRGGRGRGGRGRRMLWSPDDYRDRPIKRRHLLKTVTSMCTQSELIDTVLPLIVDAMTTWEFMLTKYDVDAVMSTSFCELYTELKNIHQHMQRMCQKYLEKATPGDIMNPNVKKFLSEDTLLSKSLGLQATMYKITNGKTQYQMLNPKPNLLDSELPLKSVSTVTSTTPRTSQLPNILPALHSGSQSLVTTPTAEVIPPTTQTQVLRGILLDSQPNSNIKINMCPSTNILTSNNNLLNTSTLNNCNINGAFVTPSISYPQISNIATVVFNSHSNEAPKTSALSTESQVSVVNTAQNKISSQTLQKPDTVSNTTGSFLDISNQQQHTAIVNSSHTPKPDISSNNLNVGTHNANKSVYNSELTQTEENDTTELLNGHGDTLESDQPPATATDENPNAATQLVIDDSVADQRIAEMLGGSTIYQTEDGYLLIQRPDGVTLQLQGDKVISLDTLQTLLSMEAPFT